ncbi:glycosyltransferase [Kitasatospora sp. NPDC059571]|uniref:glycosyltransferase n=1 Tax=Kitasatospora sp. NPDC059571 TaxID=3346871 RepID=UPI003691A27B
MARREGLTAQAAQPRTGPAPGPGGPGRRVRAVAGRAALPVALVMWLLSLRHVPLGRMNDLGLLQVLPPLFWAALVVLTLGFALVLSDRRYGGGWLAGYVLGLIAMIHATPSLLYPTLRYVWAWKHVAVIDAMIRHNGPVPDAQGFEIYNEWPGFFVLSGLVMRVTGVHSALGFAAWAPPINNALLLAPLLLLYRAVTRERTLIWGTVWIYYSVSWVGQDYFAPQAFAFLLFVTLLAVVVRRLPGARAGPDGDGGARPSQAPEAAASPGRGWSPGLLLCVLILEGAIASSHQLTPIMMISAMAVLSIPRRNRRVTLPALAGAVGWTLLWDATVARPYVEQNLHSFITALESPEGNVAAGFAGLGASAPGQVLVAWVDRGLTAVVFVLAAACLVRRPWVRRTAIPLTALAPLPLLAANNYGGEMIFRVYLFSLPSTAFLVAALLLRPGRQPRLRGAVVLVVAMSLLGGLFFGYYTKEKMNYFTVAETTAGQQMIDTAPRGAVIVTVTGEAPGSTWGYEHHVRIELAGLEKPLKELTARNPMAGLMAAVSFAPPGTPAYLMLNRAQAADCFLTGTLPADTVPRLDAQAAANPGFTTVYRNNDAVVYRFVPNPVARGFSTP